MARPTKLTRQRHDRIVNALRAGAYAEVAARAAGVHEATYYRWLARGRAEQERIDEIHDELETLRRSRARAKVARRRKLQAELVQLEHDDTYREFCEAATRANDEAEVSAIARVRAGAQGEHADWRADAWFLERRFPDRWRRRETREVTGSETAPPVRIVAGDDCDAVDAAHDFLRRVGSASPESASAD